jgi:Ni2+-binding GTPase involved in regulation of expression and maturation of urease and hydrogenase
MDRKVRIATFGGLRGSGKTVVIMSILEEIGSFDRTGVILNNVASLETVTSGYNVKAVSFPLTAPCGRARQFSGTLEKFIANNDIELVITETTGTCEETSAPLLNPLVAFHKDDMIISPLFNVIDGRTICDGIDKRTTAGLKKWQQIDESDVVIITFSEGLDDDDRTSAVRVIRNINPDCRTVFYDKEGISRIIDEMFSKAGYQRAFVN